MLYPGLTFLARVLPCSAALLSHLSAHICEWDHQTQLQREKLDLPLIYLYHTTVLFPPSPSGLSVCQCGLSGIFQSTHFYCPACHSMSGHAASPGMGDYILSCHPPADGLLQPPSHAGPPALSERMLLVCLALFSSCSCSLQRILESGDSEALFYLWLGLLWTVSLHCIPSSHTQPASTHFSIFSLDETPFTS